MKDGEGLTLLHLACWVHKTSLEVVALLLATWPEALAVKDDKGWIPFHYAYKYHEFLLIEGEHQSLEILMLLLEKWPEAIKVKNSDGETPLHLASNQMKTLSKVISLLIEKWPDAVKAKNHTGEVPLHLIAQGESTDMAALLLEIWPEAAQVENNAWQTPGEIARHDEIECIIDCVSEILEDEVSNDTATEIIKRFLQHDWMSGVALLLNRHPNFAKELGTADNVIPSFLSFVAHKCKMVAMWGMMRSRQDLLSDRVSSVLLYLDFILKCFWKAPDVFVG